MSKRPTVVIHVHSIYCATCGHWVTGLREESVQAAMLDHLIYMHQGEPSV